MKTRVLIGTNNPSKLQLMCSFFDPDKVECLSPADLGLHVDAPEDARDAVGNALQKALAFHRASGLPVLTEDSGLVFLDLPLDHPDQPGVRVRRPANHPPLTDDEDMLNFYATVVHRHGGKLRAAWQDAWCFLRSVDDYSVHADDHEALLGHAMIMLDVPCSRRTPGWPLDSLTVSKINGKYWAEMDVYERDAVTQLERANTKRERKKLLLWLQEQILQCEN